MSIPQEQWATALPNLPIESSIAQGGMAIVYKAIQASLDRPVAIKVISLDTQADGTFVTLFKKEAKTMAALDHRNICRVIDFGYERPYLYLVMELLEGGSLYQHIQADHLTPQMTIPIFSQACEGLAYAHSKGVLHQDIKPSNVMIDSEGTVKLVDFGLAEIYGQADESTPLYGTPGYVAPERLVEGEVSDHRADIYSMGALLYEMLTGQAPSPDLVPASKVANTPVALDRIISTCLAENPNQRYQDVPTLLAALKKAGRIGGAGPRLPAVGAPRSRQPAAQTAGPRLATRKRGAAPQPQPRRSKIAEAAASADIKGEAERAKLRVRGGESAKARQAVKVAPAEDRPSIQTPVNTSSSPDKAALRDAAKIRKQAEYDQKMSKGILWAGMGCLAFFASLIAFIFWFKAKQEKDKPVPVEEVVAPSRPAEIEPSAPFKNHSIPGVIQLEDYDTGGEGVAYHDSNAPTQRGQENAYRENERVDIITEGEDFRMLTSFSTGEWLKYTLNSVEAGTYDLRFRFRSPREMRGGMTLTIGDNDPLRIAPIRASEGKNFEDLFVRGISLKGGGSQVLRIESLSGRGLDLDYIEFVKADG